MAIFSGGVYKVYKKKDFSTFDLVNGYIETFVNKYISHSLLYIKFWKIIIHDKQ